MNPDEIGRNYDQIAERWLGDVFPKTNGIAQHERAIAFLENRRNALDIGCGCSGRIIEHLLGHGFSVEGIDVSSRMIELAKSRHPEITFHHADIVEWEFSKNYDLISAWDSIWHLPLEAQETTLKKILRGLAKNGVCIFSTGGVDTPEEKVDSVMGPRMYYSALGIPKTLDLLARSDCVCRHLEYDQYPEPHLFIIAQRT